MKNPYEVILEPLLSEKGTHLTEKENKYLFRVANESNKMEIKEAVEGIFKVNVVHINTVHVKGKIKRMRNRIGRTPAYKKAIVKLKQGEKIELM